MSEINEIPKEFAKVINDFCKDLFGTFPDKINRAQHELIFKILENEHLLNHETVLEEYKEVYNFCKEIYPKLFFDILYQKEELFEDTNKKVELLPNLNFRELWNTDISESTKTTIWKYLQLILFSVIGNIDSNESFGDTAKLFEAINQDEFKQKIEETISQMEDVFKNTNTNINIDSDTDINSELDNDISNSKLPNFSQIPNADDLHSHINKMMEGKLGCLAKEIAEETAQDFNIDPENANSINDVFKQLFKNPTKLMDLVKTVGGKLDTKIKSGDIKESELLEEASNLVSNMKNMPGMDNLESMLSKMGMGGIPGMGGLGKGAKMNMGALNKQMEQNLRTARMKERMQSKLAENKASSDITKVSSNIKATGVNKDGMEEFVFSTGETIEKSVKPVKKKNKPKGKKK